MSEIDYEAVLADLERRRAEMDAAISAIRQIMGGDSDSASPSVPNAPAATQGKPEAPARHAFFGMSIGDAAKKYLGMAKEPKKAVDIAAALKDGGLINTSPNFPATVATTLRREREVGNVVQLPDKSWGLAAWFPSGAKARVAAKTNGQEPATENGGAAPSNEPEQPAEQSQSDVSS